MNFPRHPFQWPFQRTGYLRVFLILVITLILQVEVVPVYRIFNVIPNLVLITVIIFAANYGGTRGAVIGFLSGLVMDVMTYSVIGLMAGIFSFSGLIVGLVTKKFYRHHALTLILCVLGCSLLEGIFVYPWGIGIGFFKHIWFLVLPTVLYNGIVAWPLREIVYKIFKPETLQFAVKNN